MASSREDVDPSESETRFASIVSSENEPSASSQRQGQSWRSYDTMGHSDTMGLERSEENQPESSRMPRQSPSLAPSQFDKPKKPPVSRRMSSKRQAPHKGLGFSTDDDVKEVEEDIAMQQANPPSSPRMRPLRKQSSTLRRRQTARASPLIPGNSDDDNGEGPSLPAPSLGPEPEPSLHGSDGGSDDDDDDDDDGGDDDDDASDAESFTLKDKQQAINETHPFGIRIWKPALYKKSRSVEKTAEGDIHSSPGGRVNNLLVLSNLLWTVFFGWWLSLAALLGAVACFAFASSSGGVAYGRIFAGLAWYILYPFGSFVRLEKNENYAEEDEGEGRSISEYEQWQNGDLEHGRLFFGPRDSRSLVGRRRSSMDSASEHDSLLGRTRRGHSRESSLPHTKRRLFGRGEWTLGRVVFFLFFYFLVGPLMLLVSLVCWLLIFFIPMARATSLLFNHLRRHPLALSFHSDTAYTRLTAKPSSSILLCTYRAAGLRYWKYTVDGTNIILINLLGVVVFVIFDYYLLRTTLGLQTWLTHPGLIFTLALLSIIPLAYFIGQAVASISAQSSMGMGAAVNAFFSTVVEVYLYCVALTEGKSQLVEGSVIGSIFAGILFLPGLSMCFGAIKRKTQRFNVKSAGVTSTMLLFAVIAAFGPTLFYQIYGSHELNCHSCVGLGDPRGRDCRRCYFSQAPTVDDKFFHKAVQPYSWFAAVLLFLSYIIGLWFTLRTHAALIWATEAEEKKATAMAQEPAPFEPRHLVPGQQTPAQKGSIRDSQLYKRILGQSLKHVGLPNNETLEQTDPAPEDTTTPYLVPPRAGGDVSREDNESLMRQVTEVAATAAAVAARDAGRRKPAQAAQTTPRPGNRENDPPRTVLEEDAGLALEHAHAGGGHDAPNWSKTKSTVVLLVATILYAVIAEILVNTVDVVLENFDIDEKFLGITLFALVPNTTEFLNAISFAMNGNIALSMEIGSAYALQVCLLQIPAVVLFSAIYARLMEPAELLRHSFNLIFPQWDMITVILCVFLLSYVYGEGKSNYFKGLILVLTYLVVVVGFYLSGYNNMDDMGVDRFDTLALGQPQVQSARFLSVGRGASGVAVAV